MAATPAYVLTTPMTVGNDLKSQKTVSSLVIIAIAINLDPALIAASQPVLSITLMDPNSGWRTTFTYRDTTVSDFWGQANGQLAASTIAAVWTKLIADGKLPAGQVVNGS